MPRVHRLAVLLTLAAALPPGTAEAQYGRYAYPRGYGDWGWQGWGASTVQGDVARGLGVLAAGVGAANVQNAQARAINAETAKQWNQYLWQSQQEANRRYQDKLARDKRTNVKSRQEISQRLRDRPTPADINRGDAMNVALDEVAAPSVSWHGLKGLAAPIEGGKIREIPFQYAAAAITTSVFQLTKGGPPQVLKAEAFSAERDALKQTGAELRRQNEEQGQLDPATLKKARDQIQALRAKVEATLEKNTPARRDAEKYLKALLGLMRMLETPAINVLLAGVENRPNTTLGDLLTFMNAFNLRFGVASTNRQKEVYQELYPLLVAVRDEIARQTSNPAPLAAAAAPAEDDRRPGEFFAGMEFENLERNPTPPAPTPRP